MKLAVTQLKDPPEVCLMPFYGQDKPLPHPSRSCRPQPDGNWRNIKENLNNGQFMIHPYLGFWSPSADSTACSFIPPGK